jgi:hypothetical protein
MEPQTIQSKIYELRGRRVMLDRDLAALYGIETKRLKEAVRRNIVRFEGEDFMFEPTIEELSRCQSGALNDDDSSRTQFASLNDYDSSRSQFVTLKNGRGSNIKYLPFAFTEMGVAMLSSVLHSPVAIEINRGIMRAFVELRQLIMTSVEIRQLSAENAEIRAKLELLERSNESILESVNDISEEVGTLYEAIGELSLKVLEPLKRPRKPIGYRTSHSEE